MRGAQVAPGDELSIPGVRFFCLVPMLAAHEPARHVRTGTAVVHTIPFDPAPPSQHKAWLAGLVGKPG